MGKNLKNKELGRGLSQRKDGKYSARFVTVGNKRIEKYFDNLQEAKLWLKDAQYDDRHGSIVATSKMTVDAWYRYWIDEIKTPTVRPNTVRNYTERYVQNIQPFIGKMLITDVKPMHCQNVVNKMYNDYKGSTIHAALLTMGIMFKCAEENGIINKNPTKSVKSNKPIEKTVRFLTKNEQIKFLNAAKYTSNYPQYQFLLETGLRTGEMVGLLWSDLDFVNRTIKIQRSLEFRYSTQEWRWGKTKSKSSCRVIPMTDTCYQLLMDLREERKQSSIEIENAEFKDVVFLNRKGMPTKNSTYDSHLFKMADKAGIERFSMHKLRHTFATRCIEAGMNPKVLQMILGHSHMSMTMDLYVHVADEEKQKEMQKLNQYTLTERLA